MGPSMLMVGGWATDGWATVLAVSGGLLLWGLAEGVTSLSGLD